LIFSETLIIILITFGIMAIKAIVLFAAGWIFKLKLNQNILFVLLLSQIGEFAFVILNLTNQLQLIPKPWHDLLLAATALTMTLTPILLIINEKWIVPLVGMKKSKAGGLEDDLDFDFSATTDKKVIIAGYGDFGNTVGRIVKYCGFHATVLDNDCDGVDLLRKLGYHVYYGDATNLNTLKAAKADEADLLIAAIDPPEINQQLVDLAKKHFPHLKILIRARNRFDAYHYHNHGDENVYRETFYTAIQVGVDALQELGVSHENAVRQGEIFKIADKASLKKLSKHSHNLEEYISISKEEIDKVHQKLKEGMDLEMVVKQEENSTES